jgi:hypothetical protein
MHEGRGDCTWKVNIKRVIEEASTYKSTLNFAGWMLANGLVFLPKNCSLVVNVLLNADNWLLILIRLACFLLIIGQENGLCI